jgi:hypothetical protein
LPESIQQVDQADHVHVVALTAEHRSSNKNAFLFRGLWFVDEQRVDLTIRVALRRLEFHDLPISIVDVDI